MNRRDLLAALGLAAILLSPVQAHPFHGAVAASSGGFTPQSGFTVTGSPTDGGIITVTSATGGFVDGSNNATHTKPFAVAPLLWAPMDTTMDGSALGRISGSSTWKGNTLAWAASCGPGGATGCASGSGTPGNGGTGTMYQYAAGFDLSEWSGWASQNSGLGYFWNDLGQQMYIYRQTEHVGFGHLDENSAANSFDGTNKYNVKSFRAFTMVGGGITQGYPDVFWAPSNQTYSVESCPGTNCGTGVSNGAPAQYINATTPGGIDVAGSLSVQQSFDGMTSGTGEYNEWKPEEIYFQTNSNASHTSYPPTSQFWYLVTGLNSNQPIENWPILNYQNETTGVNWMLVDSNSLPNGLGTMNRVYPIQYVVDGTSSCGTPCHDVPSGGYVNWHGVYVDDSYCHAVIQDSATYTSATWREIQIPTTTWNDTQLGLDLRKGEFSSLSGEYLFVIPCDTSSAASAILIGKFN